MYICLKHFLIVNNFIAMNNKDNIIYFAALALVIGSVYSLFKKVFFRNDKLISQKGIDILSSDENYEAMNKAIINARKENKKTATFTLDTNEKITVVV